MRKLCFRQVLLFLIVLILFAGTCEAQKQGQNKLDSLNSKLEHHYRTDTAKVNLMNDIAWEYQTINPVKGIDIANEAMKIAQDLKYNLGIGESYLCLGVCYYSKSDDKTALENYNKALKILTEVDDKDMVSTVYLNIGNIYFNKQDSVKTLEYYTKALHLLESIGNKRRCASVYGNIGNFYYMMCNYQKSLEYHLKAYNLAVKSGNLKVQANSLMGIANIYTRYPEYPKALEYYYRALKVFETSGNKRGMANTYGGIGIIYYRQQQNKIALENLNKARLIAEEIGDKRSCAATFTNIGNVYSQEKDYDNALKNFMNAYKLFNEINYVSGLASALGNIGQVYTEMGRYQKALYYYQQAYSVNTRINNKSGEIYNLRGIGALYLKMLTDSSARSSSESRSKVIVNKQFYIDNAINYSEKAITLGKELNELDPMIEAYTTISSAYQLKNDWKKAYFYNDSAQDLRDSIFSKENQIRISEIGAKQAAELKEKEIKIIALQVKHQRIAITAISGSLVFMIVIAILIFRSLMIKKRNNQWLEEKVKNRTLELQHSNKMLEKANMELMRLEEAKAEFLKLISHEIRTPLNGIIGFTDLLKEEIHSPEFDLILQNIDKSVKRLERFSIAALLITELKNKNVTINYSDINLFNLIHTILDVSRTKNSLKDIQFHFPDGIKQYNVKADPELLKICLETLLDNAVKHSEQSGEVFFTVAQQDHNTVLEVKDQGKGFSGEALERIFSLFSSGEKHLDNSTGLSLALVKMIMEAHGGQVDVGNNEGGGAFARLSFKN